MTPKLEMERYGVSLYNFLTLRKLTFAFLLGVMFLGWGLVSTLSAGEKVYDRNWRLQYRVEGDRVYNRDWKLQYRLRDGKIYDRHWRRQGTVKGNRIYDRNWGLKYHLQKSP